MPKPRATLPAAPPDTASINIRLSKSATDENLSKAGMLADARGLCAREGFRVVAVHVDEESGAVRDRPGFTAWLDDAREGRASVLVAWHVDRMTREGVNVAALILDAIEGKDPDTGRVIRQPARLMDCKGLDSAGDDTAFRFRFVIQAEVARAERERMRDRSKAMHARLRAAGKRAGGGRPYGFQRAEDGTLVPHPEEAEFVREVASRLLAGAKRSTVVRWANGPEGRPPRRAQAWSRVTLRQMLTTKPAGTAVDVLDPDERAALRKIFTPGTAAPSGGRTPARLLTSVMRCLSCGIRMRVRPRRKGDFTDYVCQAEPGACPHRASIRADVADEFMEAEYLRVYGDSPEYVRRPHVSGAADLEAAEAAVVAALASLGREATPEAFARLQEAQQARQAAELVPQVATVELQPTGRSLGQAWEAAEIPERRELLQRAYAEILLAPAPENWRGRDADPDARIHRVANPPHVAGVSETLTYLPGSPVVAVEG